MRNSKKLLSLALALAMALSLLPGTALAAEEDKPERGILTYSEHIAPQYEDAQSFNEGLAAVKQNGKWGYIDEDGKTVIPFTYDLAYVFNEGYAIVGKLVNTESWEHAEWDEEKEEYVTDGTMDYEYTYEVGFIDKGNKLTWFTREDYDGEIKTLETYRYDQEADDSWECIFHNGYAVIDDGYGDGGASLFNTQGKEVELTYTDTYTDWEGNVQTEERYAYPYGYPVNEGFVCTDRGYYNLSTGKILSVDFEPQDWEGGSKYISNRLPFNQGLAPVWVCTNTWGEDGNGEYYDNYSYELGFVNTSGQWVIQPFPADNYWISGVETMFRVFGATGLAMVGNPQELYGAIDKAGNTVIPFQYEDLRPVYEGMMPYKENGKWGYLNAGDLSATVPAKYEEATGFNNGMAVVYDGTKAMLIDWKGNEIPGADKLNPSTYFKTEADGSTTFYNPAEYVVIEENGKYGYGHVEYLPNLPEKDEMSDWAYEEVTAAIEENFIPVYLQNLYRSNIKREEFCDTVVQAVTEILETDAETLVLERTGKALSDWEKEYPFKDTTDSSVIAAYALGIVAGRGDGVFDPYSTIARQEAAAFLTRGARVLGMDTTVTADAAFADGEEVAGWARNDVSYVYQIKVMSGMGEDMFAPLGTYSREQSFATVYRLYQAMLAGQQ